MLASMFLAKDIHGIHGFLEGQGDLVSILITPINHVVATIIPIIDLLLNPPTLQVAVPA